MMRAILVSLAFALAACGAPTDNDGPEEVPEEAPQMSLVIGPQGAGGVSSALPLTLEAVSAAAIGYIVAEAEEGGARVITLSNADGVVFTLRGTADGAHVGEIVSTSPAAVGPYGEVIGDSRLSRIGAVNQAFCKLEPAHPVADFSCSAGEDANFWRLFQLPSWYHDARSPFEAIHNDAKYDAVMIEMRWIAPTP
jgi:hypothetical protein